MKLLISSIFILLLLTGIICDIQKIGSVYQLTDSTYDQFLRENLAVFLKLYSPQCGHCKQLAPEFSQAAEIMEDQGVVFAEVDATTELSIAEKLQIEGYPTIYFFFNGQKTEYDSERRADIIVDWIQRKMLPQITSINSIVELNELYNNTNTSVIILYLGQFEGEVYGTFNILSNEIEQIGLYFVESQSEELLEYYKPKNRLIILKKFDEQRVDLEENADNLKIEEFIKWNKVPIVMDLSMNEANAIFTDQIPCLFLFLNSNDTQLNNQLIKELQIASKEMQKKIYICTGMSNEELSQKMMEFLIILPESLPKVFIVAPKEDNVLKYSFNYEQITSETLIKFFEQFSKGELKPFYQSEDIPEIEYIENVKQLVGKNFKEFITTQNDKYLLIKFYANWCPHCKKLEPKYRKLAEKLKQANDKIILAEIESTLNEIEEQNIQGVPTLILYKPKGEPVEYSDRLTEKAIASFLQQEMKNDWINIEIDPETEEEIQEMADDEDDLLDDEGFNEEDDDEEEIQYDAEDDEQIADEEIVDEENEKKIDL